MAVRWEGGPPAARDRRTGPPRRPRGVPASSPYYAGPSYGDFSPTVSTPSTQSSESVRPAPLAQTLTRAISNLAPGLAGSLGRSQGGSAVLNRIEANNPLAGLSKHQRAIAKRQVTRELKKAVSGGVPVGVPKPFRAAVAKYGDLVDPVAPPGMTGEEYLAGTLSFESGFNTSLTGDNISSAGARAAGQFMPGTRDSFVQNYGVDPWGSLREQVKGAAMHLSGDYGHAPLYAGYNPGYGGDPIPEAAAALGPNTGSRKLTKNLLTTGIEVLGKKKVKSIVNPREPRPLQTNEMFYDPGVSLDSGSVVGDIGGHDTHLHYGSEDPRSILKVAAIANRLGLDVGENPAYGGVAPVHTEGSYHDRNMEIPKGLLDSKLYRRSGATGDVLGAGLDITGAALPKLNQILAERSGAPAGASAFSLSGAVPGAGAPALGPPVSSPTANLDRMSQGAGGGASTGAPLSQRSGNPFSNLGGAPIMSPGDLLSQLTGAGTLKPSPRRKRSSRFRSASLREPMFG